jgi:hypothetical protein
MKSRRFSRFQLVQNVLFASCPGISRDSPATSASARTSLSDV